MSVSNPRFSVVVPIYRVQGYLRECFDSVLEQSCTDFELIGVDDCSPDASGAILDEYATRDPRVVAVHLEQNSGIGGARDAGVARARGEYVFFLDSDDTLTPGTLEAMASRLDQVGEVDILLFDHARTYWWGKVIPGSGREFFEKPGKNVFTALERQEFLGMFAVVWNRLYRREFYVSNGFAFTDGIYEDALMVYKTMLAASRISFLNRICVHYRQRRRGNSMGTPGRQHFQIFTQYEKLFAFLDERPNLEAVRPFLFERMVSHYLHTFARTVRVPAAERPAFFRKASEHYRRYLPAGFTPPQGNTGLKFAMLGRGSFIAFEAMKTANKTRKSVETRLKSTKRRLGKRVVQSFYETQLKKPVDENLAVYTAYWNRGPACNPAAIYRKAKELAPHIHGVWVVNPQAAASLPADIDYVVPNTRRYWEVVARAKYLVNNVNFPNEVVKRPDVVHIQTHHGTPLKKMGIDQQSYPAAAKGMNFRALLDRVDRWDYSISSNRHSTENWERAYPSTFTTLDVGYPRNDVLVRATAEDVIAVREKLGIPADRRAVLYAPTVRDYYTGFVPRLDLARFSREIGSEFVVLVRAHYMYGEDPELRALQKQGAVIDVSSYPDVEDLQLAADALVTDYSSIMFDYANLDRPIVTYADDWEVYRKARGVYFDLFAHPPGEVATTEQELIRLFRSAAWRSERSAERRAAFRERFCNWDDGFAAERVVRQIYLGDTTEIPIVPLAERTPAPTPADAHEEVRLRAAGTRKIAGGSVATKASPGPISAS